MDRLPTKSPERPIRFKVSVSIIHILALIGEGIVFKEDHAGDGGIKMSGSLRRWRGGRDR